MAEVAAAVQAATGETVTLAYVDQGYTGDDPRQAAPARADMEAACAAVGRDPGTLEVTVGVHIAPPAAPGATADESESEPGPPPDPDRVLTGTPAEIAAAFRAYRQAGVGHIICGALAHTTYEYTSQVITHTAAALADYRTT